MDNQLPALLLSLAAIGAAYLTLRQTHRIHAARERMTKVVSPLFELLEPVMCREEVGRPIGTLRTVLSVISRGAYLAGGRLWVYRDKQELLPESKDAKDLCLLVSHEYDCLCHILGIPLRTIGYRRKTYKSYFFLREMRYRLWEGARNTLCILCIAFVLMQLFARSIWATIDANTAAAMIKSHLSAAAVLSAITAVFLWLMIKGIQKSRGTE